MPALITNAIPEQNFDRVGKRIGEILFTELTNQAENHGGVMPACFYERTTTINEVECPVLNVCFAGVPYQNQHQGYAEGSASYNIDVYTSKANTETKRGDELSADELKKILSQCAYILRHPAYKTLGYEPGFLSRVLVQSITINNPGNTMDAEAGQMGRLVLTANISESTTYQEPRNASGYLTTVYLGETEQGYQWLAQNENDNSGSIS